MSRRQILPAVTRSLALTALAAYALVGLAGYGLHSLSHSDHGHAHGAGNSDGPTASLSTHDCSICSYLAQAQSSFTPELTLAGGEPLAETPQTAASLLLSLGADAPLARGPPAA
jgi:hypothetical protein